MAGQTQPGSPGLGRQQAVQERWAAAGARSRGPFGHGKEFEFIPVVVGNQWMNE